MLIVQVTTVRERTVLEGARWEMDSITNVREGHSFSISIQTKDQKLMKYVSKQARQECALDKVGDTYSVIFKCIVKEIRHLFDVNGTTLDTMVYVSPSNMYVEGIMTYMINRDKCDSRFVQQITGPTNA